MELFCCMRSLGLYDLFHQFMCYDRLGNGNMSVETYQNETVKEKIRKAFSLKEDSASNEEIRSRLLDGGKITGTNMCVLVCAMVIASVGLNMNSTAVIIGAMLISPIMGSILASAYGNVSADYPLLKNHMIGLEYRLQSVLLQLQFISSSLLLRNRLQNCLQEHHRHFLMF